MSTSFSFGGNVKTPTNKLRRRYECLVSEEDDGSEQGFNILIPFANPSKVDLHLLQDDLKSAGIGKYRILSVTTEEEPKSKSDFNTKSMLLYESDWYKKLLPNSDYPDCPVILAIGAALYVVNQQADFDASAFMDYEMDETRYVISKRFLRTNGIVYPVFGFDSIYARDKHDPSGKHIMENYVNWRTRHFRHQLKAMKNTIQDPNEICDMRPSEVIIDDTTDKAVATIRSMMNSDELAVDTETDSLNRLEAYLGTIQLCNDCVHGHVIPRSVIDEGALWPALIKLFNSVKHLIFHNAKYDIEVIWNKKNSNLPYFWGDLVNGINLEDTMGMVHCIHSERVQGLKPNSAFYTYFCGYDNKLDEVKEKLKVENYLQIPAHILHEYAGDDVIVAQRMYRACKKRMAIISKKHPNWKDPEWNIERFYREIFMPELRAAIESEWEGMIFNKPQMVDARKELEDKVEEYKKTIVETWNKEYNAGIDLKFDFGSPQKLGALLRKMGWPVVQTEKGQDSTGADNFADWKRRGYKCVSEFEKMRSTLVCINNFITNWENLSCWHDPEGHYIPGSKFADDYDTEKGYTLRAHHNINSMAKVTFRHSVSDPSTQNIPSHDSYLGPMVKKIIGSPDEDKYKLATCDFSSLQMRIAFADTIFNKSSTDPVGLQMYGPTGHGDAHSQTGYGLFCDKTGYRVAILDDGKRIWEGSAEAKGATKFDKMTVYDFIALKKQLPFDTYRTNAKPVNFACIFGSTGNSVGQRLRTVYNFSEEDCDKVIEAVHLEKKLLENQTGKTRAKKIADIDKEHTFNGVHTWTMKECEEEFMLMQKYITVGVYFVDMFFDTYKGLQERIERENTYAKNNGYVQSWRGVIRRLPELRFFKYNAKGNVVGADKELWSRYENNLMNISANTDAQTVEAFFAFSTWARTQYFIRKNNLKSWVWNGTHDSLDMWLYEGEENLIVSIAQKIASRKFKPDAGIYMGLDAEVSDLHLRNFWDENLSKKDNEKKQRFYKHGGDIDNGTVEEEVAKYEEATGKKLWLPEDYFDDDYFPGKEKLQAPPVRRVVAQAPVRRVVKA
jgi:DNA polymerase I-like protein with 3'-5' exonuclease and polymerase domains